ncbi:leucine-rich repeat protein SHOC-2-like isoform X2 [Phymastichus coffea]|uniref:leucine-rich repeat protein SHOC-2-like isoform X2 n=1 Tax=Phymastichus coffea TaxID=108790 RepID=UPI00273B8050|nr:leucine-rich repeat protein SHOC-2-like isoform X2 [Phymastichus coffea]
MIPSFLDEILKSLHFLEMPPFQKPRSFKQDTFLLEAVNANESLKNDVQVVEDLTQKQQNTSDSNKPETNIVKCISKTVEQYSSHLTELELSNQNLHDLSDLFKSIGNLKKLYIHDSLLVELPDSIKELKNLHELNLSQNELKELPETISNLKHLEKLILTHNHLKTLPLSYAKLQLLRELDLSDNNFQCLPKCIANGLGTLRILNISENPHVQVNVIPSSKYLEKFIARNNKNCGTFPDWILNSKFFNMKEFNLDNTQFDIYTFNGKEGDLYYTKLSMTSSNLSSSYLDMMIEHMINLRIINVGNENIQGSGNVFNCIPIQSFRNPHFITEINFRRTGLGTVPTAINQLCNLKTLDLGLNTISWFPDEFYELQKLEYLKLDGNHFILFSDKIGNLISIKEIHAENNSLETLPESFQNLKNLKLIDFYNNKFNEIPEILGKIESLKGLDVEFNYFTTTDIKVGNTDYSTLKEFLRKKKCIDNRNTGVSKQDSSSDEHSSSCIGSFTDSSEDKDPFYISCDSEENWDITTDTDDEFEPNSLEINYNEHSKEYLKANFAPLGFCPADLHSVSIRQEVASMQAYGSIPSYKIVEGQFDDA